MPFGSPQTSDLPQFSTGSGYKTPFGISLLPPGTRIAAYVRSTGLQTGDDQFTAQNLVPTLSAGLARVRSGLGDTVVVLPGHSESVTDATMLTNLVAGTRVIGFGRGGNMPVFRWTATAAQWAVAVADVTIQGLRLRMEGVNNIVKALVVTAADFGLYNCDIEVSSGASNKSVIAIEFGAGSDRGELIGNQVRGVAAGVVTDVVKVVGTPDLLRFTDNEMFCAGTSATGIIHVTTVATNLRIMRNVVANVTAASIAGIGIDNVGATGVISDNYLSCLATGAMVSGTAGIAFPTGSAQLVRCFQNYVTNDPRTSGLILPTVDG